MVSKSSVTRFELTDDLPKSSYGTDLLVERLEPVIQVDFYATFNKTIVTEELTGTGTAVAVDRMAELSTGVNASSSAKLFTQKIFSLRSGQSAMIRFDGVFDSAVIGSTQKIGFDDVAVTDGISFGYVGTVFGITIRVNSVDNFTAQSDWNVDRMDGSGPSEVILNQQNGNAYQISVQATAFGCMRFSIINQNTGTFVLVHQINHSNVQTVPMLFSGDFRLIAESVNTSNATDIVLRLNSMSAFNQGSVKVTGPTFSALGERAGLTDIVNFHNILTIRGRFGFVNQRNKIQVLLRNLSITTEPGNKGVQFKVTLSANFSSTPGFINVDGNNSVIESTQDDVTVTGGTDILRGGLTKEDSLVLPAETLEIAIQSAGTITISARMARTGNSDVFGSLSWQEDF